MCLNSSCFNNVCYEGDISNHPIRSVNKIDVLRLFIHQADFSEPRNQDWDCLSTLEYGELYAEDEYSSSLSSLAWILQSSRDDRGDITNPEDTSSILWNTTLNWDIKDIRLLLADLKVDHSIGIAEGTDWTPLHYYVCFRDNALTRSLVYLGADLHATGKDSWWSTVNESPTSLSLYFSVAFAAWRHVLEEEHVSLESFVARELQNTRLFSEGWNAQYLMQAFMLNFQPSVYSEHRCEKCLRYGRGFGLVEIAWQQILQKFNFRQGVHNALRGLKTEKTSEQPYIVRQLEERRLNRRKCKDTKTTHSSESNYMGQSSTAPTLIGSGICVENPEEDNFDYKWVCFHCWHNMLGKGGYANDGNESDDGGSHDSPFLLSI
jgi:hypothetical protein